MAKILYVATSDLHLAAFHRPYIQWLADRGHRVDIAIEKRGDAEFTGLNAVHHMAFPRRLRGRDLLTTYRRLKALVDREHYDVIHCHTPIPSALVRLAARHARRRGTKVMYTAHGFHFYRGAPAAYWLTYFPVEFLLAKITDALVVVNREDYYQAHRLLRHSNVRLIRGNGSDHLRFRPRPAEECAAIRRRNGWREDDFLALYIAEMIPRKDHAFILQALPELKRRMPRLKVLFAGTGRLVEQLRREAERLQVADVVEFLGFRTDVHELCAVADLGISASRHEGLANGVVQQMMCGVPVVATLDRGHDEAISHGWNGFLFPKRSQRHFIDQVSYMHDRPARRQAMGEAARQGTEKFRLDGVLASMAEIYDEFLPRPTAR
ncbi:MAG: hypothetical protein RLZZ63_321 [Gemmatimonadota bacterium]|jgi:glycosyltransferase EpsD